MRHSLVALTMVSAITGCGGGDSSSNEDVNSPLNKAPVIQKIPDQSFHEKSSHTIIANANDPDGSIVSYQWEVISGPSITLAGNDSNQVTITIGNIDIDQKVTLKLSVTDNDNQTTTINVNVTISAFPIAVFDEERFGEMELG
ncbi:PKD domain-containing protein [Thalassotalea maritima]|uniref:PKD domain-containing protein n=1 Tax=Thalassotalea maritima TaxID=3242416 RepID=UPI0035289913